MHLNSTTGAEAGRGTPLESWKEIAPTCSGTSRPLIAGRRTSISPSIATITSRAVAFTPTERVGAWRTRRQPQQNQTFRVVAADSGVCLNHCHRPNAHDGRQRPHVGALSRLRTDCDQAGMDRCGRGVHQCSLTRRELHDLHRLESGNLAVRDLKAETSRLLTNEGTWEEPSQSAYTSRWSPDGSSLHIYGSVERSRSCVSWLWMTRSRGFYFGMIPLGVVGPQDWSRTARTSWRVSAGPASRINSLSSRSKEVLPRAQDIRAGIKPFRRGAIFAGWALHRLRRTPGGSRRQISLSWT